jgi:flavin-dependent dehydrogenase
VNGRAIEERARIIVGADGRQSTIARKVGARDHDHVPMQGGGVYAYFKDVHACGYEFWIGEGGWAMACPSNDGLTHVGTYVFAPSGHTASAASSHALAGTPQQRFDRVVQTYPDLADRVATGHRCTPLVAHRDAPAYIRQPYGPGWALVGDAGFHQGPWNGYGMSHAFRDADRLAIAIDEWLSGTRDFDTALTGYANDRDHWCRPFWHNILTVVTAYREGRPQDARRGEGERPHVRRWLQSLRHELF